MYDKFVLAFTLIFMLCLIALMSYLIAFSIGENYYTEDYGANMEEINSDGITITDLEYNQYNVFSISVSDVNISQVDEVILISGNNLDQRDIITKETFDAFNTNGELRFSAFEDDPGNTEIENKNDLNLAYDNLDLLVMDDGEVVERHKINITIFKKE